MGLYELLSQSYPEENVEPYGLCLIIPHSHFKHEWMEQLKGEGCQVFTQSYNGKVCFFIRKKQSQNQTETRVNASSSPGKPRRAKPWTREEEAELIRLRNMGLNLKEIASKLNRSKGSVMGKIGALKRQPTPGVQTDKPQINANDSVTELLNALNTLHPKYRRICLFLLRHFEDFVKEADRCE